MTDATSTMDAFHHTRFHFYNFFCSCKVFCPMSAAVGGIDMPREFSQSPHGRMAAPTGIWEHVVVAISVLIVLFCLYLCVSYFLLPREKEEGHIKKKILDDEVPADRGGDT